MSTTTDHVQELQARVEELEARLETTQLAAEADATEFGVLMARANREINRLKSQVADDKAVHTQQDGDAYDHWLKVMDKDPTRCKFGESRKRALTRARRAGLSQDDVLKVITAHARFPFLVFGRWAASGSARDRKDDLVDAFKEEKRWESLLELAVQPSVQPRSPHVPKLTRYGMADPRAEAHLNSYGHARPVSNLYAALERADCKPYLASGGQGSALCPIHDDRHSKSFRFKEDDKGGVLMYCNVCSSNFVSGEAFCEQIRQDLDLPITDLYPNRRS